MKYKRLKKLILHKGVGMRELAKMSGMRRIALYVKILGIAEFRAWEIVNISNALKLNKNEIEEIFFKQKVS